MNSVSVSCPLAVSFIFKPCPDPDPLRAGSIGVGCTIDRSISVTVKKNPSPSVLLNDSPIDFPTVRDVVAALSPVPVSVSIQSPLPLGCGFGISGASALATAKAITELFSMEKDIAAIAHTAEIKNKTGLGTVGTIITGGFLVKTAPGLPVSAYRLPFVGQKLYATILGPMLTNTMLEHTRIMTADESLAGIGSRKNPSLADILDISYAFVRDSGFLTDVSTKTLIELIRREGGHATMAIFGRVILSDILIPGQQNYPTETLRVTDMTLSL